MGCKSWKSSLPFALTFLVGLFAVTAYQKYIYVKSYEFAKTASIKTVSSKNSGGSERSNCDSSVEDKEFSSNKTTALKVLSKPKAIYTNEARQNQTQGTVRLRVTFLANGTLGAISPVKSLPNGLTEQAILAARGIKFEPQMEKGLPKSVVRQVDYIFSLY